MLIQFFQLNLMQIKYQYKVDIMVYQYQLVLLLKLNNLQYYLRKLYQMLRLELNQYWYHFGDTSHKLLHGVPALPFIHQQTLYHLLQIISEKHDLSDIQYHPLLPFFSYPLSLYSSIILSVDSS